MQSKGYVSQRSRAGVSVAKLKEVCGCSHQMARRYVLGEALPDIEITVKIAKWLNISPGWLLFGDESKVLDNINKDNLIYIESDVLEYMLLKTVPLFLITK